MILADKIIRLRKRNGWSQEELAEKMDVSRQAVSKWEASQSTPDLERILMLGRLFGVTTDYLLKDEIEDEEFTDGDSYRSCRRVTLPEAKEYLDLRKKASVRIAAATLLCIISVFPLFILGAASEIPALGVSEELAGVVGLLTLFFVIAIAVFIFIRVGYASSPYEFLEKESFETEYGVSGLIKDTRRKYQKTYSRYNCIGTCICVLSPVPLLCSAFTENDFLIVVMLTVTMLIAGIGAMFFIISGVRMASMQRLLKEGEFAPDEKSKNRVKEAVASVYWILATAVFLGWSFVTDSWEKSWIVWPVAGVLFAAVMTLCGLFTGKKDRHE